jgi:Yip1-like protein
MSEPRRAGFVARVFGMLLRPRRTWEAINDEIAEPGWLLGGYVATLAVIPAICSVIGPLTFGFSIAYIGVHMSVLGLVLGAAVGWAVTLAAVVALVVFVDLVAPAFGGERDSGQALKLIAYAGTASWVGGVAELYPNLGLPVGVLAGLYSLYALFHGLPKLMRIPTDRRLVAFAVVLLAILAATGLRGLISAKAAELGGPLSASYAPPR